MLKTLLNRYKAKKDHKQRITNPLYNLNFNLFVDTVKSVNKQVLLNELIESTGIDSNDIIAILTLDKAIEDGKALGMVTEFYTKSETYNQ